ncbi:hypothetical protein DVH24_038466 [Malus domestica]|uniref:Beta-glucosidase n=1 Tax=Malus domestica TaxID=3750 RepID=A0A498KF68_MALDO|nr:hypothetical protein DVH24_038466 [Malus domestica]
MAMRLQLLLLGVLQLTGFAAADSKTTAVIPSRYSSASLNRSNFPSGFVFGSASASYQYEGAWDEGGKGPSIWDNFTHQYPEKIIDGSNGDVADDQYHRYKEDVKIMKDMGSLSHGPDCYRLSGGVNKEGVEYYNNLINELLNKGATPYATIFHWDLPQALEEEYGGFLNRQIYWITLNEPFTFITFGYASGELAPERCSAWQNLNCTGGDSATEPYIVAHHFLLAHAHAVKASQEGVIGITLATNWFVPVSNATRHRNAANRSLDFMFMQPLTSGQYPHSMQVLVKERLPKFTQEESKLIKGSFDFVGMNYYTTHYSSDQPHNISANASFLTDARVFESTELNGVPIGPPLTYLHKLGLQAASSWLVVYPKGIREILLYAKHKYNNPLIYITENGLDEFDDPTLSRPQSLNDTHRIDYHYHHLNYLRKAINDGVNVKGYFT